MMCRKRILNEIIDGRRGSKKMKKAGKLSDKKARACICSAGVSDDLFT